MGGVQVCQCACKCEKVGGREWETKALGARSGMGGVGDQVLSVIVDEGFLNCPL